MITANIKPCTQRDNPGVDRYIAGHQRLAKRVYRSIRIVIFEARADAVATMVSERPAVAAAAAPLALAAEAAGEIIGMTIMDMPRTTLAVKTPIAFMG